MRRRPTQADQLKYWVRGFKLSLVKVVRCRQRHFSMLPPKRKTRCAIKTASSFPKFSCKEKGKGKKEDRKSRWSWRRRYFELELARALFRLSLWS